jgi:hypothetical protein
MDIGFNDKRFIRTKKADVELTNDQHILIRIHENNDVDLEDAKEIHAAKSRLANGKKHTVLFVTPEHGNLSREARNYSASEEVNKDAIAKAVISRNLASSLIIRFFITVNKPPALTKLFFCEKAAAGWLSEMREKAG